MTLMCHGFGEDMRKSDNPSIKGFNEMIVDFNVLGPLIVYRAPAI